MMEDRKALPGVVFLAIFWYVCYCMYIVTMYMDWGDYAAKVELDVNVSLFHTVKKWS